MAPKKFWIKLSSLSLFASLLTLMTSISAPAKNLKTVKKSSFFAQSATVSSLKVTLDNQIESHFNSIASALQNKLSTLQNQIKDSINSDSSDSGGFKTFQIRSFGLLSALVTIFDNGLNNNLRSELKKELSNFLNQYLVENQLAAQLYQLPGVNLNRALVNTLEVDQINTSISTFLNNYQKQIKALSEIDFQNLEKSDNPPSTISETTEAQKVKNFFINTQFNKSFENLLKDKTLKDNRNNLVRAFYLSLALDDSFSSTSSQTLYHQDSALTNHIHQINDDLFTVLAHANFDSQTVSTSNQSFALSTKDSIKTKTNLQNRNQFIWDLSDFNSVFENAFNKLEETYKKDKEFIEKKNSDNSFQNIILTTTDNAPTKEGDVTLFDKFFYGADDFQIEIKEGTNAPKIYQNLELVPLSKILSYDPGHEQSSEATIKAQIVYNNALVEQDFRFLNTSQNLIFDSLDNSIDEIKKRLSALQSTITKENAAYLYQSEQTLAFLKSANLSQILTSEFLAKLAIAPNSQLETMAEQFGLKAVSLSLAPDTNLETPNTQKSLIDALIAQDQVTIAFKVSPQSKPREEYILSNFFLKVPLSSFFASNVDTLFSELINQAEELVPRVNTQFFPLDLEPQALVNRFQNSSESDKARFFNVLNNDPKLQYTFKTLTLDPENNSKAILRTEITLLNHPRFHKTYETSISLKTAIDRAQELQFSLKDQFLEFSFDNLATFFRLNNDSFKVIEAGEINPLTPFMIKNSSELELENLNYTIKSLELDTQNLGLAHLKVTISSEQLVDLSRDFDTKVAIPQEIINAYNNLSLDLRVSKAIFTNKEVITKAEFLSEYQKRQNLQNELERQEALNSLLSIVRSSLDPNQFNYLIKRFNHLDASERAISVDYQISPKDPLLLEPRFNLSRTFANLRIQGLLGASTLESLVAQAPALKYDLISATKKNYARDPILELTTNSLEGGKITEKGLSHFLMLQTNPYPSRLKYQIVKAHRGNANTEIALEVEISALEDEAIKRTYIVAIKNLKPFALNEADLEDQNDFAELIDRQKELLQDPENDFVKKLLIGGGAAILAQNGILDNITANALKETKAATNINSMHEYENLDPAAKAEFDKILNDNVNASLIKTLAHADYDSQELNDNVDQFKNDFMKILEAEGIDTEADAIQEIIKQIEASPQEIAKTLTDNDLSLEDIKNLTNDNLELLKTAAQSIKNGELNFSELAKIAKLLRNFDIKSFRKVTNSVSQSLIYGGISLLSLISLTSLIILLKRKAFKSGRMKISKRTLLSLAKIILGTSLAGIVLLIFQLLQ